MFMKLSRLLAIGAVYAQPGGVNKTLSNEPAGFGGKYPVT
jgi:hypothetical protein